MRVTFFLHDSEPSAEFLSDQFNVYCSSEFLKNLNIQNDENAVIQYKVERETIRSVYCCFKNYSELKKKKKIDSYSIYTVDAVLKSLGINITHKNISNNVNNKNVTVDVEIQKGEKYIPLKELELRIVKTFYDSNQEFLNESYVEKTNIMAQNIWNDLKKNNMDTYVNLSLLNICLFEQNLVKLNILGFGLHLIVNRLVTQSKNEKKETNTKTVCVPYVSHNSKIIIKNDEEQEEKKDTDVNQTEEDINSKTPQKELLKEKKGLEKIGGYKKIKEELYYYVLLPLIYKNVYDKFHIDINRGILLHGPPGCGKTFVALALKEELRVLQKRINRINAKNSIFLEKTKDEEETSKHEETQVLLPVMEIHKSTDLIDKNNSGEKLSEIFSRCCKRYKEEKRCSIVFIDEIEILCEKREDVNVNFYTTTLLNNMDGVKKNTHTILIGATNFIHKIDLALRRSGRFDREIEISIPTLKDRIEILKKKLSNITHNIDQKKVKRIADLCQSFTCSDITALINVALYTSLKERNIISHELFKKEKRNLKKQKRKEKTVEIKENKIITINEHENENEKIIPEENIMNAVNTYSSVVLTNKHLLKALQIVKPSGMKELYVDIPKTKIKDIGGYKFVKTCIKECLIYPKKFKKIYKQYNIRSPKGILLYGPPGCSKTLFAKAIASEINMNFISVKGPEIFSKYVGESEKTIRYIFKKAKENNPCVIFFDEIDSIAMNRNVNQNFVSNRVLCQLLNEIDGLYNLMNVVILAATNRPDLIDPALLRPGRFDRIIYVPLPDYASRVSIFKKTLKYYKNNNMLSGEEMYHLKKTKSIIENQNEKHYFEMEQKEINHENENIQIQKKECQTKNALENENSSFHRNDLVEINKKENFKKCSKNYKNEAGFIQLCRYLAKRTKNYSGAEIVNLCREASICALRETLKIVKRNRKKKKIEIEQKNMPNIMYPRNNLIALSKRHFVKVLKTTKPQTPKSLIKFYKEYNKSK